MAGKLTIRGSGFKFTGALADRRKLSRAIKLLVEEEGSRVKPLDMRKVQSILYSAGGYCFNEVPPSATRVEVVNNEVWLVCTEHKTQHRVRRG